MKKMLVVSLFMIMGLCSACSKESPSTEKEEVTDKEIQTEQLEDDKELEKDKEAVHFSTEYIPFDYMEGYTIIKRSKETELFGLLDENGEIVLEPEYDDLDFTVMNEQQFVKANFEGEIGILDLKGDEKVKYNDYKDIVSAGNIGWLAEKTDGTQVLLDKDGKESRELNGKYTGVLDDKYLYDRTADLFDAEKYDKALASTDIYDLEENLLWDYNKQIENGKQLYAYSGIDEQFLWFKYSPEEEYTYLEAGNINGENAVSIATGNDGVKDIFIEDNIIEINRSDFNNSNLGNNCLAANLEDGNYYFDLLKKEFVDYKPDKIIFEEVGNFYKAQNPAREIEIENKIQEVEEIGSDGYYLVEDIDSQVALIDKKGNILIPFGEDLRLDGADFYYKGEEASKYESETSFAIRILNDERQYEIYGFNSTNQ